MRDKKLDMHTKTWMYNWKFHLQDDIVEDLNRSGSLTMLIPSTLHDLTFIINKQTDRGVVAWNCSAEDCECCEHCEKAVMRGIVISRKVNRWYMLGLKVYNREGGLMMEVER